MAASDAMTGTVGSQTATTSDAYAARLRAGSHPFGLEVVVSPDGGFAPGRVPTDRALTLGRHGDAELEVAVRDRALSRRHARFDPQEPGACTVEDLGSRNGTWVNGARVERAALTSGDVVRVGNTVLVFGALAEPPPAHDGILARSATLCRLLEETAALASGDLPVVVVGETGTGKEVVARFLHEASGRRGAWIALNCAAIPKELVESTLFGHRAGAFTGATTSAPGVFAEARGGTLFLDEVTELPLAHQAKLLRVLEGGEFTPVGSPRVERSDARVVCATNADLPAEVMAGTFRKDLFARLTGAVLRIPPLRHRRMDIAPLASHFYGDGEPPWTAGFVESLLLQRWPLNARGLRNVMVRCRMLAARGPLTRSALRAAIEDIGMELPPDAPARATSQGAPDAEDLRNALAAHGGVVARVARALGKDPRQIYRWLAAYRIDVDAYRR